MRGASKLILTFSLSTAAILLGSCSKEKVYDIQEYANISLQLNSFGISHSENAALSSYFFAISNTEGTGSISNRVPLPYETELRDVTLPLSANGDVTITVAIGSDPPVEWKADTKWTIPAHSELTIKLTSKSNTAHTYSYIVKLNQYRYNPESISWSQQANNSSNLLQAGGQGFAFATTAGVAPILAEVGRTDMLQLSANAMPTPTAIMALPNGRLVKRVVSSANGTYALDTMGQLYKLESSSWSTLPSATGILDLLSVLSDDKLALLVTPSRGIQIDTSLPSGRQAIFATYSRGEGVTVGTNYAPEGFPALRANDRFHSFSKTATYEGASSFLVGATPGSAPNKSLRSTWFTTDGLQWGERKSQELEEATPKAMSVFTLDNMYYRLESHTSGISVYYSTDALSWTKSGDIALQGLTPTEWANANFVAWGEGNNIYILRGATAGSSSTVLFKGEVLRNRI